MPIRLKEHWPALAVVLAAAVPYLPTLDDYFVRDDFGVVWLLSQKPWTTFPQWFVSTWMDNIWGYTPDELRPFPAVTYQFAAWFGPGWPLPNHAINIAFHVVNALLVLWIARRAAGLDRPSALTAAIVFAVLPIQAESVAWITGRVDSMPACVYFAAFGFYVRWRQDGARRDYLWAVVLCFVALFTKQNTITLGPALVLYDLMVARRAIRLSWSWIAPYVPFAALIAGFLALRYQLFNALAREDSLNNQRVQEFLQYSATHLKHLVFGDATLTFTSGLAIALVVLMVVGLAFTRLQRAGLYFGIVWIALGIAPILVAGYYSPRHVYLASLGWAVLVGCVLQAVIVATPTRIVGNGAAAAAVALILIYTVQLFAAVGEWERLARTSQQAVMDVEREALASPEGTLIVTGAPAPSWMFALPHALRPPFTRSDLTRRVRVISSSANHCCAASQWDVYTRDAMRSWLAQADAPPVVALYWDPMTASLSRLSDRQDPYLRTLMGVLLTTRNSTALDEGIQRSLRDGVAGRR